MSKFLEVKEKRKRRVRTLNELEQTPKLEKKDEILVPVVHENLTYNSKISKFSPKRRNKSGSPRTRARKSRAMRTNTINLKPIRGLSNTLAPARRKSLVHRISSSNSIRSSGVSKLSDATKKPRKTSVFQFDSEKFREKMGLIDEEENKGYANTNFFQIVNVMNHSRRGKGSQNEGSRKEMGEGDLFEILRRKEIEIKNLRIVIEHMRIGIETRDDTIMRLNHELKTIKDLFSLEIGKFKKHPGMADKLGSGVDKATEDHKKVVGMRKRPKSRNYLNFNDNSMKDSGIKVSDIFYSTQKIRTGGRCYLQNTQDFNLNKFTNSDFCSKILIEMAASENNLKQVSKFFHNHTKKGLNILRNLRETYFSKINAIAFLQNLTTKFTKLGRMGIVELSDHIEDDLSQMINCEKSQILFYNKSLNTFFTTKQNKNPNKKQNLDLTNLDPDSWFVRELINGQDLKHTEVDDEKKELIQQHFGDKFGIKITGYLSIKVVKDEKLLGVLLCFNKNVLKKDFNRLSSTKNYTHDELTLIKIYRNAISSVFSGSLAIYFSKLKNKAIKYIFNISLGIIGCFDLAGMVRNGEATLRELFNTNDAKIMLVKNSKFLHLDQTKEDSDIQRLKYIDSMQQGGIFYEVYAKKKPKFSENTKNDAYFNYHCDLGTILPSLTYPILDTDSFNIVAIFQISLWQETFRNVEEEGVDLTNQIFLDFAETFSKFYSYLLSFYNKIKERRPFRGDWGGKFTPSIYDVAKMKLITKQANDKMKQSMMRVKRKLRMTRDYEVEGQS